MHPESGDGATISWWQGSLGRGKALVEIIDLFLRLEVKTVCLRAFGCISEPGFLFPDLALFLPDDREQGLSNGLALLCRPSGQAQSSTADS